MLRQETDLVTYQIYIGATVFENPTIAKLKPVMLAHEHGWRDVSPVDFPEGEVVFSLDPVVVRKPEGHVVLFTVEPNPRGGRERFITTQVEEPYELFHGLGGMGPEELRRTIVQTGIERGYQESSRILVPIGSDRLAIPAMRPIGTTSKWVLSYQEPADRIPLYKKHPEGLSWIQVNGRRFALPGRVNTEVVGHINWQTDMDFLQSLLRRIRKSAGFRSGGDDFNLSERVIEKVCSFYRDNEIIGDDVGAHAAARARLEEFIAKLTSGSSAASEIATALFDHPSVKDGMAKLSSDALAAIEQRETERIRPAIEAKIQREIADSVAKAEALRRDVEEAERSLSERTLELQRIERLTDEGLASLRTGVGSFLDDVRATGRTFAELMQAAGTASVEGAPRPAVSERLAIEDRPPPWTVSIPKTGTAISIVELPEIARKSVKASGLAEPDIRKLDILCRAGEIPVLVGDSVERMLACYASIVSSGRIVRMPLDPTVLGPDDLWRNASRSGATQFAQAWDAATRDASIPQLVCLDDIDRASLSDWMGRFRILYRANRPSSLLVVATLSSDKATDFASGGAVDTIVTADGAATGLAAAVTRSVPVIPPVHHLADVATAAVSQDEREGLFLVLKEMGIQGGDEGARLLAIYGSARSWFDEDHSISFVRDIAKRDARIGRPSGAVASKPTEASRAIGN
jgi:hypothetical protein